MLCVSGKRCRRELEIGDEVYVGVPYAVAPAENATNRTRARPVSLPHGVGLSTDVPTPFANRCSATARFPGTRDREVVGLARVALQMTAQQTREHRVRYRVVSRAALERAEAPHHSAAHCDEC